MSSWGRDEYSCNKMLNGNLDLDSPFWLQLSMYRILKPSTC